MPPSDTAPSTKPVLAGLAFSIDAALPQTQCTRCGYPDCASYAQAIAHEGAPINQCPPGGQEGIARLAALTGRAVTALNPQFGIEGPVTLARIDENWCIGCTLCLKACPTDAILGANKLMHTVIAAHCTGCELCIPVCPVDCIELDVVDATVSGWAAWSTEQAQHAKQRYQAHQQRVAANPAEATNAQATAPAPVQVPDKKAAIAAALAKARGLRQG
ncbi:MAG: RnfABCDGE type electron transport complex subunit B [Comamonas sp.]|nr:RnfABCDGE type electron transport complex subunit B [Candidatus Comamonas equi]